MAKLICGSSFGLALLLVGCGGAPTKEDQPARNVQAVVFADGLTPVALDEISQLNKLRARLHAGAMSADDLVKFELLRAKYRLKGISARPDDTALRRTVNTALLSYYRAEESATYPSGDKLPHTCLALSGGGLRSASVSIGVLSELAEQGVLRTVDVYSSVSGGGYALGRLFLLGAKQQRTLTEIATDRSFVSDVDPDIEAKYLAPGVLLGRLFFSNATTAGASVGNFSNGFDSTDEKIAYATVVASAFGYPFFAPDLRTYVITRRQGLPLFNVAAFPVGNHFVDPQNGLAAKFVLYGLDESLFEFTPLRIGSPAAGYTDKWPVPLGGWRDVVAISGAAPDSPFKPISTPFSIRIGGRMNLVLPGLFVPDGVAEGSVQGFSQAFFATDGGFVENLGVAALVRRGCSRIIAVDSEYDPAWRFEGYGILKQRLKTEHELDLNSNDLDRFFDSCDNKIRRADGIDVPDDSDLCTKSGGVVRSSNASQAVESTGFTATIGSMPILDESKAASDVDIKVVLLKVGLTRESRSDPAISEWLATCSQSKPDCMFPMDPTTVLKYDKAQFQAYVQLGRRLVRENRTQIRDMLGQP